MRIELLELRRVSMPLVTPFRTSFGTSHTRGTFVLRLVTTDGVEELHLEQNEVRALTAQTFWFESRPSTVDPGSYHESKEWSTLVTLP